MEGVRGTRRGGAQKERAANGGGRTEAGAGEGTPEVWPAAMPGAAVMAAKGGRRGGGAGGGGAFDSACGSEKAAATAAVDSVCAGARKIYSSFPMGKEKVVVGEGIYSWLGIEKEKGGGRARGTGERGRGSRAGVGMRGWRQERGRGLRRE